MARSARILTAVAAALGIAALGAGSAPAAGPAAISVINLPADAGGQVFYAEAMGFFKEAGLDVHITNMTSGPAITSAVASGAADVGISVVSSAALARERGIKVRFIAPGALWSAAEPTAGLLVTKDSGLRKAADFNGKTIAVTGLADLTYYATRAWLEQNGANVATVQFVELPFPQMGAAVAQHRVNGATLAEPFLTNAERTLEMVAPVDDAIAKRFMTTGWIASETWLRAHPDVAAKFASAIRRTSEWANAHRKESAAILLRNTKISPAIAATMHRVEYGLELEPKMLQPAIDVAAKYSGNVAKGPWTVSAADLIWKP